MALFFDRLTIPPAGSLNNAASGAGKRQLAAAGSRAAVPLVYGQDRIGALILNVLPSVTAGQVLVQCLWAFACDSVSEVRLNDIALPGGAAITHYTGAQTAPDGSLVAAFAAQSIGYAQTLNGFAYSVLSIPSASFDGQLSITALVRGRTLYDPRKDSTAGGSGAHRRLDPSTWEWSDNPSLALADFCGNAVYGAGATVDWTSVAAAANANDVLVGSPSEKRRTIGLAMTLASDAADVAESLRAYAGVFLLPGANGIRLLPDQDDAPVADYDHNAGQIAAIEPLQLRDLGQVPTAVEVIYTDTRVIPWREASATATVSGAGTTRPWRLSQVRLPGVQRYSQALREATERINKLLLQDLTTSLEVFDIGIRHEKGDIVTVSHPLGLLVAPMRVAAVSSPSLGRWRLGLVRHDPAAYSDTVVAPPGLSDTQRVISLAAAAALSKTLTIRINADSFSGATNYSEGYIHGIDNGTPVDAPGQILVNGVATAAPNGQINTNRGPVSAFIVWARTTPFAAPSVGPRSYVMARKVATGWEYDDNSAAWVPFTPEPQHVIIGTIETAAADSNSPPGITAASIWAAATTLDAIGSLSDAGYAAQTAASAAAASASSALSTLATMRSNGFLDAAEKPAVIREWQRISDERAGIVAQANTFGIVTERNAYTAAHDALNAYLSSLSPPYNDTSSDTPITPAVDQATWAALYVARQALLNKLADEAAKRASWLTVSGRPASYRVGAYGLSAVSAPMGPDLLNADTNALLLGGGPMYRVAKINRATKAVTNLGNFNPLSGALGALGECNAMAAALDSIDSAHICVVFTYDEPGTNRLLGNLPAAMYRNGASRAVFGSSEFKFRGAYILVGIGGSGEGNGAENYAGAVDSDPNAWCETSFQITATGALIVSGTSRGATSIVDFGYTGDLNATRGAPAGTLVGSVAAEAVESISGAQAKADAAAAAAQSAAQAYAAAQAAAADVSARAYADGVVDAEEARAIADAAAKAEAARVAAVAAAAADATAKADVAATTALWSGVSGVNVTTSQIAPSAATLVSTGRTAGPINITADRFTPLNYGSYNQVSSLSFTPDPSTGSNVDIIVTAQFNWEITAGSVSSDYVEGLLGDPAVFDAFGSRRAGEIVPAGQFRQGSTIVSQRFSKPGNVALTISLYCGGFAYNSRQVSNIEMRAEVVKR